MAGTNAAEWRPLLWPHEWAAPEMSRLLSGSAVDCIVLPGSAAHMEAPAREAGFHTIVTSESGFEAPAGVSIVQDGVWPKIARSKGDPDATDAGPTGLPWIDSNGWRIQLATARSTGKTPWVRFDPPQSEVLGASAYGIAIADCEAHGGRWLISLDGGLSRGLSAGNSAALETWKTLLDTLSFFRSRQSPGDLASIAALGVLSDFSGDNEFLGEEFLNLIAREYVPVRILLKTGAVAPLDGLRMVVYLDGQPLPPQWKEALAGFARTGRTLVTTRSADPGLGVRSNPITGLEYELRTLGQGRIAVSAEDFDDPWRVAADAHVLLGRSNDLLRQANAGAMSVSLTATSDARRARLQLVNYSGRPGLNPVTLTLLHRYRSARFRSLENPGGADIPLEREHERTAVYLPRFSVCGTVDLET